MTADLLRRAASLMRERAEAATFFDPAGALVPWHLDPNDFDEGDGEHVNSWSPAVALAVADWLDAACFNRPDPLALAVARAYLGETP